MAYACPVCHETTNGSGAPFNGRHAILTHVAAKARIGDPDHFRWVDKYTPGSLTKSANVFGLTRDLERVVPDELSVLT
jgi:hypothetical protein